MSVSVRVGVSVSVGMSVSVNVDMSVDMNIGVGLDVNVGVNLDVTTILCHRKLNAVVNAVYKLTGLTPAVYVCTRRT